MTTKNGKGCWQVTRVGDVVLVGWRVGWVGPRLEQLRPWGSMENEGETVQARTLIAGATGQVGTQMLRYVRERRGEGVALPTTRHERAGWLRLDFGELETVKQAAALFDAYELDSVYCVAGMTAVDACEDEPDLAMRTNARGPGVLAAYAQRRNVPFVYFSTEYVFDGDPKHPGPYAEDAPLRPLSVYGRSKLAGEEAVLAACACALVLRTTVVYGPDARQKNYLYSLMRNLATGTPMRVPEDQVSTPTYNVDLIAAAMGLVACGASGVFHVCGPEVLGRLEFAREIADKLGLDGSLLEGVSTAQLGQKAARPLAAGLATGKLRGLYPQLRMRGVREAIEECAAELRGFLEGVRAG